MAESIYQIRMLTIIPVAKVAAIVNWFNANIDPNSLDSAKMIGLSGDGSAPATYQAACLSLTLDQARLVLNAMSTRSGLATVNVATWNAATKAQKRAFADSRQAAMWANDGIYFDFADNQGSWRPKAEAIAFLAAQGVTLKTIGDD